MADLRDPELIKLLGTFKQEIAQTKCPKCWRIRTWSRSETEPVRLSNDCECVNSETEVERMHKEALAAKWEPYHNPNGK